MLRRRVTDRLKGGGLQEIVTAKRSLGDLNLTQFEITR